LKAIKRHQEIIELVKAQGYVSTEDLVERFNVSPQTTKSNETMVARP